GKVKFVLRDYLGALADYNRAVELRPSSFDVYVARADFKRDIKKYYEAYTDYSKAIELNPSCIEAYYKRGNVASMLNDYKKAFRDISTAMELNANDDKLYANRAQIRVGGFDASSPEGISKIKLAIQDIDTAIMINHFSADHYNQRGNYYFDLNMIDKAIRDFNQAITMDSTNGEFFNNRGLAKMQQEEYKSANTDFTKAIKISPDKEYYYRNRGLTRFNGGKYKSAINDYSKAIELIEGVRNFPDDKSVKFKLTNAYLVRGLAYIAIKNGLEACRDFFKAAELGERRANNYINRYCTK
ncbi:MAG: tetratricopeptide repeat protein, partial [Pseudomonadales bacterium]|nr:tetratricopeptide repeat protein [Pseudomonadales bacterium]